MYIFHGQSQRSDSHRKWHSESLETLRTPTIGLEVLKLSNEPLELPMEICERPPFFAQPWHTGDAQILRILSLQCLHEGFDVFSNRVHERKDERRYACGRRRADVAMPNILASDINCFFSD